MMHERFAVLPQAGNVPNSQRRTCVLVLGMHRSGTSAFARVLNLLGCDLPGTLMGPGKGNESGHWESQAIADFNDRLLESAGSSWDDWLPINPAWLVSPKAAQFREEALGVLDKEFGTSHLFVLKDPRICRLAPFWLSVLGAQGILPRVIIPIRDPQEVAMSLVERDGFEPAYGHLLWLRNVLDAEYSSRGRARFFASYDRLLKNWGELATNTAEALDLPWPRRLLQADAEISGFLSKKLRHHETAMEDTARNPLLADWVRDVLSVLLKWTISGEQLEDLSILDRVRGEFDAAAPAFVQLVNANRGSKERVRRLEATAAMLRPQLDEALKISAARFETSAQLEHTLSNVSQQLASSNRQLADRSAEREKLANAVAAAEQKMAETRQKHDEMERQSVAEVERLRQVEGDLSTIRQKLLEREGVITSMASERDALSYAASTAEHALVAVRNELNQQVEKYMAIQRSQEELTFRLSQAESLLPQVQAQLVESQQWVFTLSTERVELESKVRALEGRLTKGDNQIESMAVQLREVASQRDAERIEANDVASLLSERISEVAVLSELLREKGEALSSMHNRLAELNADRGAVTHAVLTAEHAREVAEKSREVAEQSREAAEQRCESAERSRKAAEHACESVKAEMSSATDALRAAKTRLEKQLAERFSEISVLTRVIEERRATVNRMDEQIDWARTTAAILVDESGSWKDKVFALLPTFATRNWRLRQLKRKGLFDADAYLASHSDVLRSGMDPLRHYLRHGIREGRVLGIDGNGS